MNQEICLLQNRDSEHSFQVPAFLLEHFKSYLDSLEIKVQEIKSCLEGGTSQAAIYELSIEGGDTSSLDSVLASFLNEQGIVHIRDKLTPGGTVSINYRFYGP